jgi:excisionase family DNA binding protein
VNTSDIEWLNTNETAKRLGITPRTLYRFIDDGKIPAYRFGRVIRLKESEVAEFIERSRIVPGTLDITASADDDSADADTTETTQTG